MRKYSKFEWICFCFFCCSLSAGYNFDYCVQSEIEKESEVRITLNRKCAIPLLFFLRLFLSKHDHTNGYTISKYSTLVAFAFYFFSSLPPFVPYIYKFYSFYSDNTLDFQPFELQIFIQNVGTWNKNFLYYAITVFSFSFFLCVCFKVHKPNIKNNKNIFWIGILFCWFNV